MNVSGVIRDEYSESLSSASILVIDDEPGMRHFMTKILEPRCKRVEQAASAAEASDILDKAHFDLIVLDNIMPGKSGLDWVAEQRRVGLFADTILVTAYADLDTAIQALRIGIADFQLEGVFHRRAAAAARADDDEIGHRQSR